MSFTKRVQKLLFSEYCDFEDMVLIESPFAQTTKEGKGIRQLHIGLTSSKLVLATDVLPPVEKSFIGYVPGIDPVIETFELIAIYPIECVNLSVYRKHKRQTIKARFCNNRVFYFELGGFERRNMFWNLWCEKVKFLSPENSGSSHSETSVATSTTGSTLYLVDSKQVVKPNGLKQLWCKFGTGKKHSSGIVKKWTDRYLYLGKNFEEFPSHYKPLASPPKLADFLNSSQHFRKRTVGNFSLSNSTHQTSDSSLRHDIHIGDSYQINRFGLGVREGCSSGLFLPAEDYIVPRRYSYLTDQSSGLCTEGRLILNGNGDADYPSPPDNTSSRDNLMFLFEMAESCVRLWELHKETDPNKHKSRHRRRYGFAPQPLFLHGLGPWNISPGARYSIQIKRAVSMVSIRRQPIEPELRLPVAKRQLVATVSCETLHLVMDDDTGRNRQNSVSFTHHPKNSCGCIRRPVIFFWTPDYWYRPRSAKEAYQELQRHLAKLKAYQKKNKKRRKRLFRRRTCNPAKNNCAMSLSSSDDSEHSARGSIFSKRSACTPTRTHNKINNKKRTMLSTVLGLSHNHKSTDNKVLCCLNVTSDNERKSKEKSGLQFLKRLLKIDVNLTAWDFNSTTLAQQLTIIDRDLFLKISPRELSVLVFQQSSKNAPNVAAIVAFSHRISCLVASDILKNECERARARLVARFINVAYKCHLIANFQSCRTILFGLQSPAVFRMKLTWAYVRKKHACKYEIFEFLCRLYKDPRLFSYQKASFLSSQQTPYLPFIGDIIAKLLDRVPQYKIQSRGDLKTVVKKIVSPKDEDHVDDSNNRGVFTKLLISMKWLNVNDCKVLPDGQSKVKTSVKTNFNVNRSQLKGLCDYFHPLNYFEDNRAKRLGETTEFLQQSQLSALHYNFNGNSLASDYLLKARYKEERDNFFRSFTVEEPCSI